MSVSFGCLLLSALSLMSRGSYAILCPFAPLSYEVSGPPDRLSGLFGAGDATRLPSSLSFAPAPPPPPAPRLRVRPDADEDIGATLSLSCYCSTGVE